MTQVTTVNLRAPYLIFVGDIKDVIYAKTGAGIVQWCPEAVAGQLRLTNEAADLGVPEMDIASAKAAGVKSLVIGVAHVGGAICDSWVAVLNQAAAAGLDIVSGLHTDLHSVPGLIENAKAGGSKLINVRKPPSSLPIGNGKKRTGKRLLMVGTDCAVGKKYTALAVTKAMTEAGYNATFRATGQTGIMIAGSGIAIDSVVADFISGAAEVISPANVPDHWDVIEGQGSLFNPSYSGVSMGLLHGSQPDAIVVCHDAGRKQISSCPDYGLPTLKACIEMNLYCARVVNPAAVCLGVSVNTSALPADERVRYLQQISDELGLPCFDPILDGCDQLLTEMRDCQFLPEQTRLSEQA